VGDDGNVADVTAGLHGHGTILSAIECAPDHARLTMHARSLDEPSRPSAHQCSQRRKDREVGRKPAHVIQLGLGEHAQLVMVLQGARLTSSDPCQPHLHHVSVAERPTSDRGTFHLGAELDLDPELLTDLTEERILRLFPLLDLSAGQLPPAGQRGRLCPSAAEHRGRPSEVIDDRGADDAGWDIDGGIHVAHSLPPGSTFRPRLATVVIMSRLLTDQEITRQLDNLPGWRRDGDSLVASYDSPDFPTAVQLIVNAGDEAEQMEHHPDVDLRWKVTHWRLSTHSAGGLTQLDIELAHRISQAATRLGALSTASK
jgi:4a-hydroxytetrahydrobiopterin dehydratase